jgi:hypothetical protein
MPHELKPMTDAGIQQEVDRYLTTGASDDGFPGWPGRGYFAWAESAHRILREALIAEVRNREAECRLVPPPKPVDIAHLARDKAMPMVKGLFPSVEQEPILRLLEGSVTFVTGENIQELLTGTTWHRTAWDLANIYLGSIGARRLGDAESEVVGLSEETTCYVSLAYFEENDPFADFIVHEMAHVFHNWKRESVSLPYTRYREWLLAIDYSKRETFAYACEAYSRIVERATDGADRARLLSEYIAHWMPVTDKVKPDDLIGALDEAIRARNGWKRILQRCAPPPKRAAVRGAGAGGGI